jgi:hypothetical protein
MSHASVIVAPTVEQVKALGIEKAIEWEMQPFDENKANECFADGTRWDWFVVGGRFDGLFAGKNVVQIKNLDLAACEQQRHEWLAEAYKSYTESKSPFSDIQEGEILEQYIARRRANKPPIHAYAFLRNRHWNEAERMGWWGMTAYTECELKDMEKPKADAEKWFGKCLYKDEENGARIICWNEPEEIWSSLFYKRFIEPLNPEETIAVVDYHV